MRPKMSYANVVATLALVVALGTGGAWAATQISGKLLQNRSVGGKKLKKNTVTGKEVKEGKLAKVPKAGLADTAANAARLGGIASTGFVQGGGHLLTGHSTGTNAGGVVKTFATPTGTFTLSCTSGADTRYKNTTAGDAEVYRTVGVVAGPEVGEEPNDTDRDLVTKAANEDIGYTATNASGPKIIELRVGKGTNASILTASANRDGNACSWTWELLTSG